MRIPTDALITVFIAGAVVGAIPGSIITYLNLTRDKRLISRIRNEISERGCYLDLSGAQLRKVERPAATAELVSDARILQVARWARAAQSELKLSPDLRGLTATVILFEDLLGLTWQDAVAMRKDESVRYLDDTAAYVKKLQAKKSSSSEATAPPLAAG
jgi:hypothetical protein